MVGRDAQIAVYLMTDRMRGTLYIGVTSQLRQRVWQHREGKVAGFTKTYGLKRLVWYEQHSDMLTAIQREKSLKRWPREWKINLIEREIQTGTTSIRRSHRPSLHHPRHPRPCA